LCGSSVCYIVCYEFIELWPQVEPPATANFSKLKGPSFKGCAKGFKPRSHLSHRDTQGARQCYQRKRLLSNKQKCFKLCFQRFFCLIHLLILSFFVVFSFHSLLPVWQVSRHSSYQHSIG